MWARSRTASGARALGIISTSTRAPRAALELAATLRRSDVRRGEKRSTSAKATTRVLAEPHVDRVDAVDDAAAAERRGERADLRDRRHGSAPAAGRRSSRIESSLRRLVERRGGGAPIVSAAAAAARGRGSLRATRACGSPVRRHRSSRSGTLMVRAHDAQRRDEAHREREKSAGAAEHRPRRHPSCRRPSVAAAATEAPPPHGRRRRHAVLRDSGAGGGAPYAAAAARPRRRVPDGELGALNVLRAAGAATAARPRARARRHGRARARRPSKARRIE